MALVGSYAAPYGLLRSTKVTGSLRPLDLSWIRAPRLRLVRNDVVLAVHGETHQSEIRWLLSYETINSQLGGQW